MLALNDTADLFGKCEVYAQKEQWDDILILQPTMSESIDLLVQWCERMLQLRS